MMFEALIHIVLPVLLVAVIGYVYTGYKRFDIRQLTDLIIYLTSGCLIFDALTRAEPFTIDSLKIPLSVSGVVGGGLVTSYLLLILLQRRRPTLSYAAIALPVTFINVGNLGLPFAQLAFGDEGLRIATIIFIPFQLLQYTVGIGIASGLDGLRDLFKLPLIYATLLGLFINLREWRVPDLIAIPIHNIAMVSLTLMLLALGMQIRTMIQTLRADGNTIHGMAHPLRDTAWTAGLITVVRFVTGIIVALLMNRWVSNEPQVARILLLMSSLPPAVMTFALAEKYQRDPDRVSLAILFGTLLTVVVTPFVLATLV